MGTLFCRGTINNAGAIKTELEKELGDVDKFAGDMSEGVDGLANALAERIEATANKAKIDKSITVDLKSIKKSEFPGGATWENPGQDEMADDDTVDVLYTIPKKGTPGKIAFKLVLTQPGAKPYEVDCLTKDNVSVTAKGNEFMSLDDADTALGAIWSDGANNTKDLKELIDKNTEDEIQKRIEELIDKALDGSKLLEREVSVTVNEAATDKAGGTATATVTISDKAQRAASGQEYADKVYTVNVTIPQMTTEVTGVTLALDVTKNGKKQDVAITSKEAKIENIGTDGCTVKIVPTIEGTWLTEAQKKSVKFAFTKADEGDWTEITGVMLDGQTGAVEIDYSKIAGKDAEVKIKATVTETVTPENSAGGDPDAGRQKESVTITFKFATNTTAAGLFKQDAMKSIAEGVKVEYTLGADDAVELADEATAKADLKTAATTWLTKQDGYKNFEVASVDIDLASASKTNLTAKVFYHIGSAKSDELELELVPSEAQAKKDAADELADNVKDALRNEINKSVIDGIDDDALKGAVKAFIKEEAKAVLEAKDEVTVTEATVAGDSSKVTVSFTVTKDSTVSKTIENVEISVNDDMSQS